MAPKVTSSSNRNKRGSKKPVTKGQNPQRANRQTASNATVSQSGGGRGSGARVTNASQRTTSGSARVTGGARPALPPGRSGGALATRPPTQSTRQANARAQLRDASRGSTGPNRVGQPAGSANRMYGANVVNNSVNRAVTQTNLRGALAKGAAPTAIAGALLNAPAEFKKLQALLRNPKGALSRASSDILSGKPYDPQTVTKASKPKPKPSAGRRTNPNAAKPAKPKPKPNMDRPGLRYEKLADTRAPRSAYGLKDKPTPGTTRASTPSRSSSASTPSRSSTPARSSAAASRPASRPAASATSAERRVSASTSNRESGNYGTSKTNNPLMKDMVARMKAREDKAQAAAASKLTYKPNKDSGYTPKDKVKGSKDYSSQFKDMKGGSSRFAAELKKKKKGYKLF
jgi:hypothetical protein